MSASTPRRSSRLKAKEEKREQRATVLRKARRRAPDGKTRGLLESESESEGVREEEGGGVSSSEEILVTTPFKTPPSNRVKNFLKVHHSYNRDCGPGHYDVYERDFIDDSEPLSELRKKRERKSFSSTPVKKVAAKKKHVLSDSEEESSQDERFKRRRNRDGGARSVRSRGGSEERRTSLLSPVADGEASAAVDDEDIILSARRRRRTATQFDSDESSDSADSAVPSYKRRRCKQLESDEEIGPDLVTPSRARSSRAQKLRQQRKRERDGKLKELRAMRAKQKGMPQDSDSSGSKENEEEDDGGSAPPTDAGERARQALFPESGSSEEDSDWIVEDYYCLTSTDSRMPVDAGEQERGWESMFSTKSLFSSSSEPVWFDAGAEVAADREDDERGLVPLIYAAGCTHPRVFSSLLRLSSLSSVHSLLAPSHTTLLHVILESPLTDTWTDRPPPAAMEDEGHAMKEPSKLERQLRISELWNQDKCPCTSTNGEESCSVVSPTLQDREEQEDSASLACLEAVYRHDRSHFEYLLRQSGRGRPTALEMAVWYGKPKCLDFLLCEARANPFNRGLLETDDDSDIFETMSPDLDFVSRPPSLLHLAVLHQERGGGSGKSSQLLEQLLPLIREELEVKDEQGYSPLMHASSSGDRPSLMTLLKHGASINCRDPSGTSPLHLAALSGSLECAEILIAHGHPIDCRDSKGWSPLLYAHFASHQECVLALMRAKPSQLSVLSELLKRTPEDGTDGRMKTIKVVRSLLVSLAHHEAYFSLFNDFVSKNLSVLEDDSFGFMKHCMRLLSFENKQAWLRSKLQRLREHAYELVGTMRSEVDLPTLWDISRDNILLMAHSKLRDASAVQCWLGPLQVKFRGEAGVCSGPRREFWACFSRALAKGEEQLFVACDEGQLSLQPCTVFYKYCRALTQPALERHREMLHVAGMLLASAVFHGDIVDVNLTQPLIKQLLGVALTHPSDLEHVDRTFHHCITTSLLNEGFTDLELTFTCTLLSPWDNQSIEVPMVEGGRAMLVKEENKREYLSQLSHFKLEGCLQSELEVFSSGFWKIIPRKCLQVFTPNEFSLLLSGVPKIDVLDWQSNTEYSVGLSSSCETVQWFWRLVSSLKEEEKALLLKFSTGSPRVPAGGFANLQGLSGLTKFRISLMPGVNKIPQAATCFNNLKLSSYSCEQELRDKILIAIRYGCEGFEFS